MNENTILLTGGLGFIGSALVRDLVGNKKKRVINIDCMTYAGHSDNLGSVSEDPLYKHLAINICQFDQVQKAIEEYQPEIIVHLAAESHVDRSISGAEVFIDTNIKGTFNMLEAARHYWASLPSDQAARFRFHHVSTDEVYGHLGSEGYFNENSPYQPRSPYSSSKAASDHLVRAWGHTYGLPTLITNCSNNYGPYQYPEKLIPVVITKAIKGEKIPVYGKGLNVRDWLHVEDHVSALKLVMEKGSLGETYLIGGYGERSNIDLVHHICQILDDLQPRENGETYKNQIEFVTDRAGHDFRYAIDPSKIKEDLGWTAQVPFEEGLKQTIQWYLDHPDWCERALSRKSR